MSSTSPHTYDHPTIDNHMLPTPSTSTSFGSLARSASLGRRKDPYAYSSDDVESGLGNMDMDDHPSWQGYVRDGTSLQTVPPPQPHPSRPSRELASITGRSTSDYSMQPPPFPSHVLSKPMQDRVDSGGSSSGRVANYSHSHREAFHHYQPRNDGLPPLPNSSGNLAGQWNEYPGSRIGAFLPPSTPLTQNQVSASSDYPPTSPYSRPDVHSDTSHASSPMPNPYEASPGDMMRIPSSPQRTDAWPRHDEVPHSYIAGSLSSRSHSASQPVTPAGKYGSRAIWEAPTASHPSKSPASFDFREVTGSADLAIAPPRRLNHGRRADPSVPGRYLSPLKCLTTALPQTYSLCNPHFHYETSENPRRVLTKPSKPVHNDGADNEDWDYILYVNDLLGGEGGRDRYLILDVLGQGTFGQVVKCQNMRTHDICAVKVVKNKPAYLNQSKMEVAILDLLNREYDANDQHHILRMLDSFTHKNHLCLVFECLSSNLYELIKQNQFKGLSTQLVKVFTQQLLECLAVLKDARLIHCDLKPENILLKSLQSPQIKVIDFGSACHEMQTVYTYIQSRFYRSPEVLLGLPYSTSIDMWSLGCIVVELYLGLPLFPGTSEYNQVSRIMGMMGLPPTHLLEVGKQTHEFFNLLGVDAYGKKQYALKPMDQYSKEHHTNEQPSKQYFKQTQLADIIMEYPYSRKSAKQSDIDKEMANRRAFVDFVQGLLNLDPVQRWSPQQAAKHPFITGEKFSGPFQPNTAPARRAVATTPPEASTQHTPAASTSKKYGGLVQSPSAQRGQRVYADATAYHQQLSSHQSYTAQMQSASAKRNQPFSASHESPHQPQNASHGHQRTTSHTHQRSSASGPWQHMPPPPQPMFGQHRAPPQSHGSHAAHRTQDLATSAQTNPPPNSYYPSSRNRANTINNMDAIPPALARLSHFGVPDPSGTRNLTPIMNREDAMREWERRQGGHSKNSSLVNASYPQLEYLQEQAELAAMGNQGWVLPGPHGANRPSGHRSSHSHSLSTSNHQYHMQPPIGSTPQHPVPRDYGRQASDYAISPSVMSRSYLPTYPPPAATSTPHSAGPFDAFESRDPSLGMMYTPLQPNPPNHPNFSFPGHGHRASYSGPFHDNGMPTAGPNNPFVQPRHLSQQPSSPRYGQNQGYGV